MHSVTKKKKYILYFSLKFNEIKYKLYRKSPTQPIYLIQISLYLVQVCYMFKPYMVIIRLAHKKQNKHAVMFKIKISMLYICIVYNIYIYIYQVG